MSRRYRAPRPGPVVVAFPSVRVEPSPRGGLHLSARSGDRSFHAVVRHDSETMIYVRDEAGLRTGKGWAAVDEWPSIARHVGDLLQWAVSGPLDEACRTIATKGA